MSWSTPAILAVGTVLTAADWNAIAGDLKLLGTSCPSARLKCTSQQQNAWNTAALVDTFTATYLTGGVTFTSNKLIVPIAGRYDVGCQMAWGLSSGSTLPEAWYATLLYVTGSRNSQLGPTIFTSTTPRIKTGLITGGRVIVTLAANAQVSFYGLCSASTSIYAGTTGTNKQFATLRYLGPT